MTYSPDGYARYPADAMAQAIAEFTSNEMWQHNPARDEQGRVAPSPRGDMKAMDSPSGDCPRPAANPDLLVWWGWPVCAQP